MSQYGALLEKDWCTGKEDTVCHFPQLFQQVATSEGKPWFIGRIKYIHTKSNGFIFRMSLEKDMLWHLVMQEKSSKETIRNL